MPDRLTTPEGVDKLTDEIAAKLSKLRMSTDKVANGNVPPPATKLQIIAVVAAILSPIITLIGGGYFMQSYWRGVEATEKRFENLEREQKVSKEERDRLTADVARIDKDRSARIADLDRWRDGVENELRVYRIGHSEFQQQKGVVVELGKKLGDGRDERLRDRETDRTAQQQSTERIMGAVSGLRTEVALLRQLIEGPGRRSDRPPFGGESQMWIVPPTPETKAPYIQKATLSAPARLAPRRGVKRRSATRPVLLAQLTRNLERTFGRPHYKRRTWP